MYVSQNITVIAQAFQVGRSIAGRSLARSLQPVNEAAQLDRRQFLSFFLPPPSRRLKQLGRQAASGVGDNGTEAAARAPAR